VRGELGDLEVTGVGLASGAVRAGDLYVGVLASLVALWFPPALGGLIIMALIGVLVRVVNPGFRTYDARTPTL